MKDLVKYLLCGITNAGVTAPVTYFTTKEDIKENEEFKAILTEITEKEEEKKVLNTKIKDSETRITKLEKCINSAKAVEHYERNRRTGVMDKKIKVWFGNTTTCDY